MTVNGLHAREHAVREEAEAQLERGLAGKPLHRLVTAISCEKRGRGLPAANAPALTAPVFSACFARLCAPWAETLPGESNP